MAVDKQRIKTTLTNVKNSVSTTSPEFFNTVNEVQLKLYELLWQDTEIIVDNEVKNKFKAIYDRLHTWSIGTEITTKKGANLAQITNNQDTINNIQGRLNWTITPIVPANQVQSVIIEIGRLQTEITKLQQENFNLDNVDRTAREAEYKELYNTANVFSYIQTPFSPIANPVRFDQSLLTRTHDVIVDADAKFRRTTGIPVVNAMDISYTLCDENGNTLEKDTNGKYVYKYAGKEILLSWIDETTNHGQFNFKKLVAEPALEDKELKLSIKAWKKTPDNLYTMTTEKKNFTLALQGTSLATPDAREQVIEDVNNQPWTVLSTKLTSDYTTNHADYEKEMLLKICKKAFTDTGGSDAKWKELFPSEAHETELYQRLRTARAGQPFATTLTTPAYFTNFDDAGTPPNPVNKGFKSRYADDKKEWNKKQENIKNQTTYRNYLMSTYPTEIENYMKEKFENVFSADPAHTFITSAFLHFKDEQEARGKDNNSHMHLDSRLPNRPKKSRDNYLLGMIPFGKKRNYVSLFTGAEKKISGEKLALRDMLTNKLEEISYDLDLKVLSANKMIVKITKKDPKTGKELAVMEKSGGDPTTLIRKVIRGLPQLKGKERMHIAYNIMRSLIEIAKDKKIPLQYKANGSNEMRTLRVEDSGNIIGERENVNTTTYRSTVDTLFDYNEHFASTQNWDCGGTSLESWIIGVMGYFDEAMQHTYQNYRNTVSNVLFKNPDKLNTKINVRRYQPFKLLNNLRNKKKFTYDIPSTTVGDGNVSISFNEKNVFEITLQRYGETYMFEESNLKKILKASRPTKTWKKRVFEGIGNEVLALIHNQHFKVLSENTKLAQDDQLFAAKDPQTGRRYFMDNDGRLSYAEHWDNLTMNGIQREITSASNRKRGFNVTGALGATAGAGRLGVGAVGAGLSVAGVAKGAGAGALAGVAGQKRFTKIFHKNEENYGIIHSDANVNAGRTYLSAEEQDQLLHSNPVLMGRLRKAMKNRMGMYESARAGIAKMRA